MPLARELAAAPHLVLVCGRYEGIDERARALADREVSIGDYVLTGGELPGAGPDRRRRPPGAGRHRGRFARVRLLRRWPAGGAAVHAPGAIPRRVGAAGPPLGPPRRGGALAARRGTPPHARAPPRPAGQRPRSATRIGPSCGGCREEDERRPERSLSAVEGRCYTPPVAAAWRSRSSRSRQSAAHQPADNPRLMPR